MEAASWMPHIPAPSASFRSKRMKPFSPQFGPRLFLSSQQGLSPSLPQPTSSMPRSTMLVQSPVQTPFSQSMNFQEATATVTGCWMTADRSLSYFWEGTEAQPLMEILLIEGEYLHFWTLLTKGQALSEASPASMMYQQACSMKPPPHPSLPQSSEQSISCCSEYFTSLSNFKAARDQIAATAEIAQFAAQAPSLITVFSMILLSFQFTASGGLGASAMDPLHLSVICAAVLSSIFLLMSAWMLEYRSLYYYSVM